MNEKFDIVEEVNAYENIFGILSNYDSNMNHIYSVPYVNHMNNKHTNDMGMFNRCTIFVWSFTSNIITDVKNSKCKNTTHDPNSSHVWFLKEQWYCSIIESICHAFSSIVYCTCIHTLVVASITGYVCLFDEHGICFNIFCAHTDIITHMIWIDHTSQLVTCALDGTIKVWNLFHYRYSHISNSTANVFIDSPCPSPIPTYVPSPISAKEIAISQQSSKIFYLPNVNGINDYSDDISKCMLVAFYMYLYIVIYFMIVTVINNRNFGDTPFDDYLLSDKKRIRSQMKTTLMSTVVFEDNSMNGEIIHDEQPSDLMDYQQILTSDMIINLHENSTSDDERLIARKFKVRQKKKNRFQNSSKSESPLSPMSDPTEDTFHSRNDFAHHVSNYQYEYQPAVEEYIERDHSSSSIHYRNGSTDYSLAVSTKRKKSRNPFDSLP